MPKGRKRLNKHDRYVSELCAELRNTYDVVLPHVVLKPDKKPVGEIDIYARKGTKIDLYEVKCSNRRIKARKQLKKAKRLLELGDDSDTYFYCGESDKMEEVRTD